jgi:putative endopeptidase
VGTAADVIPGLDLTWQQPGVRPQDDLFRHVNGRWLDEVPIPPDRATCGTLRDLQDTVEQQLRDIAERAAAGPAADGSDERKIGDLYASFLNVELAERLGLAPVRPDLDAIARAGSVTSLARVLGRLQRAGVPGVLQVSVGPDARRPDRYLLHLGQGGLGLPDESYYRAESFAAVRMSYREHLARVLGLAELADPGGVADRIIALETRIASWHRDRVRARDVVQGYTLASRAGLGELAPGFPWDAWLDGLGAPAPALAEVVIRQPEFLHALSAAFEEAARSPAALADWRSWLAWRVLRAMSPLLSRDFAAENFAFYQGTLAGVGQQPERWKRGLRVVESAFGQALGRIYVARHFPPQSRDQVLELVAGLVEAHRRGIEALEWMSPPTKERALGKLAAFTSKIGYPDREGGRGGGRGDYGPVQIRRDDLAGNVRRANAAEMERQFGKLGGPVDRSEWLMTPQTVNALYDRGLNQITFPAAILQPPLFSPDADPAVNYGAIGAVIGHELCHGFDDQGSRYDGAGNLAEWWTESDRAAYDERTAALIAQFGALAPAQAPARRVNGALTLGENIGDLGGLIVAYRAYLLSLDGREPPVIGGLTGPQRFFLSWARIWRGKVREAEAIRRLANDPHSPRELRCNAIARNLDEFHQAFGVQPGDGMWLAPAERVRIW